MKRGKGAAALVLIALAADVGYVLVKGVKGILKQEAPGESNRKDK